MRLVDTGWSDELDRGLAADSSAFEIVTPFIKHKSIKRLLGKHSPGNVRVVTRFKLADFAAGVSDIAALREILDAGGSVRGLNGLHAKVFIFGKTMAAVTSANLTQAGLNTNYEFGCVSDDAGFVEACRQYFERLWAACAPTVTQNQLCRWDEIVQRYQLGGGRPQDSRDLPDFGAQPDADLLAPSPSSGNGALTASSRKSFVKIFGEGSNRVNHTFPVFEEVQRSGCHWACGYPTTKTPRAVGDGDEMFLGRLARKPNDILVFGRATGLAHVPERDRATEQEIQERPWKAKWGNYVRVHDARFLAGLMSNGVSLESSDGGSGRRCLH